MIHKRIISRICGYHLRLEVEEAKDMDTKDMRNKLMQTLVDSAFQGDLSRGVLWSGPRDLPRRWLPHGSYYDLYTLYCSKQLSNGERVASRTTFYRVLKTSGWKKKIKFAPPSSHSKCSVCARLKGKIQSATGIQAHADACDKLLRHLSGQFADRACYYECRSRSRTSSDLLRIISDSMDRSKFSLPRFPRGRVPKDIENLKRPSCEMTTQIVHGVGIYTYLSDEDQTSGTTWVLETLNRTLQSVHTTLEKSGKRCPPIVKLFADNTPKDSLVCCKILKEIAKSQTFFLSLSLYLFYLFLQEVKNGIFGSWASMMVGAGYAQILSHEHLPVGHTHEDIGTLSLKFDGLNVFTVYYVFFHCHSLPWLIRVLQLRCVLRYAMSLHPWRKWWAAGSSAEPVGNILPWSSMLSVPSWLKNKIKTRQHPQDIVEWGAQCFVFHFGPCHTSMLKQSVSLCTSRLLMKKVSHLFTSKGLEFKVEYVNNIRDWPGTLPSISTLYGAYRRRSIRDTEIVPHSFTFIRRDRQLDWLNNASYSLALQLLRK